MSRVKTLFLSSWYPSRVNPMLGNFNERFAEAVATMNEVYVLNVVADSKMDTPFEMIFDEKSNYKQLTIYFRKKPHESFFDKLLKSYRYFKYAKKGYKIIEESWGKPQVTHLNVIYPFGLFAWYLKRYYSIPYLVNESWTGYLAGRANKVSRIRRFLTKRIAKNASFICPVTEHLKESMVAWGVTGNYAVVPNVIDSEVFYPAVNIATRKIRRLIHISTCDDEHKNISGMLRVVRAVHENYPDLTLDIISERPRLEVEQIAKSVDENFRDYIKIHVSIPPTEVANFLRESDSLIHFSNYETFSVVLAEAWSCGIPAIYSKCGGLTEINDQRLGVQVEVKNELLLREALMKVVAGQISFNQDEIAVFAQKFQVEAVANGFSQLYRTMV